MVTSAQKADILIIGAGIVGVQIARALQQAGQSVLLVDRDTPGMGCSYGNAGYIAVDEIRPLARASTLKKLPSMLMRPLSPLSINLRAFPSLIPWFLRLSHACRPSQVKAATEILASLMMVTPQSWAEKIAGNNLSPLFKNKGLLRIFETASALKGDTEEQAQQAANGVALENWSADTVHQRCPNLASSVIGGIYYPDGFHTINPFAVVKEIYNHFCSDGGIFFTADINRLERDPAGTYIAHHSGGQISAGKIIIAAGHASKPLAATLDLNLPLITERGYHQMLTGAEDLLPMPVASTERGFIMTPMDMGLRLAGTVEFTNIKQAPNWRRADILKAHTDQLLSHHGGVYGDRWHGNRPTLPDYLPAIGESQRLPNLFTATGHQHLGLTLSAVTADIITDKVLGRHSALDISLLSPDRFS